MFIDNQFVFLACNGIIAILIAHKYFRWHAQIREFLATLQQTEMIGFIKEIHFLGFCRDIHQEQFHCLVMSLNGDMGPTKRATPPASHPDV